MYSQGAFYEMEGELITEIEHFMCWVLENYPEKHQIHCCLGLLNEYLKGDPLQAKLDYQYFLDKFEGKRFAVYQRRSKQFIETMD